MGSPAPPTYCGPESASSSAATDGAGAASRSGPAGWARRPSSQRWTPSAPWRPRWTATTSWTIEEAAAIGDIFITLTGGLKAVGGDHLEAMKDGALIANSGHFNDEIDIEALEEMAEAKRRVRPFVDEYTLEDGRRLSLLGEGRLINLAAAEGHPPAVMDMSFANQALSIEYLAQRAHTLPPAVYPVPREIDEKVGKLKLSAMGITIDTLTADQERYLASWQEGT